MARGASRQTVAAAPVPHSRTPPVYRPYCYAALISTDHTVTYSTTVDVVYSLLIVEGVITQEVPAKVTGLLAQSQNCATQIRKPSTAFYTQYDTVLEINRNSTHSSDEVSVVALFHQTSRRLRNYVAQPMKDCLITFSRTKLICWTISSHRYQRPLTLQSSLT